MIGTREDVRSRIKRKVTIAFSIHNALSLHGEADDRARFHLPCSATSSFVCCLRISRAKRPAPECGPHPDVDEQRVCGQIGTAQGRKTQGPWRISESARAVCHGLGNRCSAGAGAAAPPTMSESRDWATFNDRCGFFGPDCIVLAKPFRQGRRLVRGDNAGALVGTAPPKVGRSSRHRGALRPRKSAAGIPSSRTLRGFFPGQGAPDPS